MANKKTIKLQIDFANNGRSIGWQRNSPSLGHIFTCHTTVAGQQALTVSSFLQDLSSFTSMT